MTLTYTEARAQELTARLMDYYETFGDQFDLNFGEKVSAAIDIYRHMITDKEANSWADTLEEELEINLEDYESEEEFDNAYQYEWTANDIRDLISDLRNF